MADNDNEIVAAEIQETDFGEKVAIESPFESRHYIKHLPWKTYEEEVDEHGSLLEKAESRASEPLDEAEVDAINAMEDYGFDPNFAAHVSWDPNGLGIDEGAWTIDKDAFYDAADFWQFAGFNVSIADGVEL